MKMDVGYLKDAIINLPDFLKWEGHTWIYFRVSYYKDDIQITFKKNYETYHWELGKYKIIKK